MSESTGPSASDSVGRGVFLGLALHLLQIVIVPAITMLGDLFSRPGPEAGLGGLAFAVAAWSLTQFLYIGPAAWWQNRKGKRETAKGMLILAGIGVLLNGGCDALLFRR